jgi:hypothetical protein
MNTVECPGLGKKIEIEKKGKSGYKFVVYSKSTSAPLEVKNLKTATNSLKHMAALILATCNESWVTAACPQRSTCPIRSAHENPKSHLPQN